MAFQHLHDMHLIPYVPGTLVQYGVFEGIQLFSIMRCYRSYEIDTDMKSVNLSKL